MTLTFISQDGTAFNYTNAVACVTCGDYEDDTVPERVFRRA